MEDCNPTNHRLFVEWAARPWDALVVGAGPAGCITARELARCGKRTLLVERSVFPRPKVCGGCLNHAATAVLYDAGLGEVLKTVAAIPLDKVVIACGGRQATLPLVDNVSISRDVFDAALADAAVSAGVTFAQGITAQPAGISREWREVELTQRSESVRVAAKVVVVAAGLNGWRETDESRQRHAAASSRIGAGTTLSEVPPDLPRGVISMSVGTRGYVGMVWTGERRVNVAAAFDREFLAQCGSPAAAAATTLQQAGVACPIDLSNVAWVGTPPLTHRLTRVSGERLFVVGDAAGYVEPFTGEGMAWALRSGMLVAPLAAGVVDDDTQDWAARWETIYREAFSHRMSECAAIGAILRRPWLAKLAVAALARVPWLAKPILNRINRTPRQNSLVES